MLRKIAAEPAPTGEEGIQDVAAMICSAQEGCQANGSCSKLAAGAPGIKAMRDFAIGLGVAIFIALFTIYLYQPSLYHHWFRVFFE